MDNIMKCIYCNSETDLTSSDIITYAITGAKLTKTFVCKTHNAFTNDNYEKKFVSDLDFFRNHLGLTTRDGKLIQYKADVMVDGSTIHNVKISNKEALFSPKDVIAGTDGDGHKVLMAPLDRLQKISKGNATEIDMSDVVVHTTIESESFLGFNAIHSVAKMAYEWYCYNNNIEEYKEEFHEIVEYILGNNEKELVDILIDGNYYDAMDRLSEIGTNSFFQYDDVDGYRYVVFDFWKTIAYRVRICKSLSGNIFNREQIFNLYLYHLDGSKSQTVFGTYRLGSFLKSMFTTLKPENLTIDMWRFIVGRIEQIMSTMILSIHILKREVDQLTVKLKRYDTGKIEFIHLLGFEENNIITTIDIIGQLYLHKSEYVKTNSFNQNLMTILSLNEDKITRTFDDKKAFLQFLAQKDKDNTLSEYLWNSIQTFNEIYENEICRINAM